MINNLQIFKNEQFGEIRVASKNNEPYFCLTDLCKTLDISNPADVKKRLNQKGIDSIDTLTNGGNQKLIYVNEGNLYKVIFQSRKEEAERFQDWITDDVLPTIRKTGGYVSNEDLFIDTYLPYMDENTKLIFRNTLSMVRKQNEIIAIQKSTIEGQGKEIEHKDEVIIGLVDEITLAEKRQILNRVVRYKGAKFQERWQELYKQFSMKYHLDLAVRLETYNKIHKPKLKNKVDYIDKVMNKIPELYEIACKLYESDVKELSNNLYSLNEEVC